MPYCSTYPRESRSATPVAATMSPSRSGAQRYCPCAYQSCAHVMGCSCGACRRCMGVILAQMRQLPAFWTRQQEGVWEPATRQLIQSQQPDVGVMDDLEVLPAGKALGRPSAVVSRLCGAMACKLRTCPRRRTRKSSSWGMGASGEPWKRGWLPSALASGALPALPARA